MGRIGITTAVLLLAAHGGAVRERRTRSLQRICTLGMEQSQAETLAQALLDSIGPRLSGAPDQQRATTGSCTCTQLGHRREA
jgi:hypothetical protein